MNDRTAQSPKRFSLEEANLRLPLVRAIVKDIVTLFSDLHDRRERLNELRTRSEHSEYRDEVEAGTAPGDPFDPAIAHVGGVFCAYAHPDDGAD